MERGLRVPRSRQCHPWAGQKKAEDTRSYDIIVVSFHYPGIVNQTTPADFFDLSPLEK